MCVGGVGRAGLRAVEEIWVVAALAKLHEDVEQPHLLHLASAVQNVQIFGQNLGEKKKMESVKRAVRAVRKKREERREKEGKKRQSIILHQEKRGWHVKEEGRGEKRRNKGTIITTI